MDEELRLTLGESMGLLSEIVDFFDRNPHIANNLGLEGWQEHTENFLEVTRDRLKPDLKDVN